MFGSRDNLQEMNITRAGSRLQFALRFEKPNRVRKPTHNNTSDRPVLAIDADPARLEVSVDGNASSRVERGQQSGQNLRGPNSWSRCTFRGGAARDIHENSGMWRRAVGKRPRARVMQLKEAQRS
jgi:hypothetical protein